MKRRFAKKIFNQMIEAITTEKEVSGKRARYLLHQSFKAGLFPAIGYFHCSRPKFNVNRDYILIPIDLDGEKYHPTTILDFVKYGPKWMDEIDIQPIKVISDRERRLSRLNKTLISVPSRDSFRREA